MNRGAAARPGDRLRWLSERIVAPRRPHPLVGLAATALLVTLATLAVGALTRLAPATALSVVYLPGVLLVSVSWGLAQGVVCSVVSAAAFNFFHVPPTGHFTVADSRNWVTLAALLVVAIAVSAVADLARARAGEAQAGRREADLAAALARELLLGGDLDAALHGAARRLAEGLGLAAVAIRVPPAPGAGRELVIALDPHGEGEDGSTVASLHVAPGLPAAEQERLRERIAPTLAALVAIARRREQMQAERVRTAALRRSDEIKTALLRTVSHDLRTPLTSIMAAGHALASDALPDADRRELSASVVSEAGRLADLVDKLLDLSRLQAGAAPPRADWVSLEEVVTAAAENHPEIDVRVRVDADVPEVRADAAQLERAVANLLENARRHGGPAPVQVHVRHSGERVLVSVVDRGPGIAPAERARIWEPFYRVGDHRRADGSPVPGSGLGLAIVKGFVEGNGGTIAVDSLPGQGTSFVIALPAPGVPTAAIGR